MVPKLGAFFTPLRLVDAFQEYDEFFSLSRRKYVPPNFAELRHILNIAQARPPGGSACAADHRICWLCEPCSQDILFALQLGLRAAANNPPRRHDFEEFALRVLRGSSHQPTIALTRSTLCV